MGPALVSLVIATYRRPDMLCDTLDSLEKLRVPAGAAVEVLVIDNDPDGSARAAFEGWVAGPRRFAYRYVHELRKGLSHARNRGIDESAGQFIAFLDDDLFVDENWLQAMLDCFATTNAGVVGGRTVIHWEGEPAQVVRDCVQQVGALDMGQQNREIRGRQLPGGGNAVFRRGVFDGGRRFCAELGRVGNVLLSGEDSEMFQRLRHDRVPLWYCGGALVRHRTGGERLTAKYLVNLRYWFGVSDALVDARINGRLYQFARAAARGGKALLLDVPAWCLGLVTGSPTKRLLARASLMKQLGYLRATLWPWGIVPASRRDEG